MIQIYCPFDKCPSVLYYYYRHWSGRIAPHRRIRRRGGSGKTMYYFYVLRFKQNGKLYKGFTDDLKRRISEHRSKSSKFTSRNGFFDLIFYEAYLNKKDAQEAERYFKTGHGREVLEDKLKNSLHGGVA